MRRAPIVLTATAAGTAAVLGFHTHPANVSTKANATASPAAKPSGSASKGDSAATSGSSSGAAHSATGDAMSTRYGPAQVRVTVSDGKITKIEAVELQNSDPKSAEISGYAEPILRQSVLERQTAAVDVVSGATYTSLSYEASLQSALDTLGFKASDGTVAPIDVSQLQ